MADVPKRIRVFQLLKPVPNFDVADIESYFQIVEIDTPQLESGQVLVKIECSPINPSDLYNLDGTYNSDVVLTYPVGVGFEGSGTVVQSAGELAVGKRVGFFVSKGSTWAEHIVVSESQCAVLPDDVTFEEGCSCFVNPLTVVSFVEIVKSRGLKSVLHTAAASALGKMLVRYCHEEGIEILCIVRRAEQVKTLQDIGAKHIVNTSEENWKSQVKAKCEELNILLGFDAIAGPITGEILQAMPFGSEIKVYGGLSGQASSGLSPGDFIFRQKKVSGFWLNCYLNERSPETRKAMIDAVTSRLKTSFATDVRVSYPLEKVADAVKDYIKNMTLGKVAFKPSQK